MGHVNLSCTTKVAVHKTIWGAFSLLHDEQMTYAKALAGKLIDWTIMSKTFISIGECMAELQATDDGLYRLGFAGDTLNTAWYMRAMTRAENVTVDYVTAVGTDPLSSKMLAFLKSNGVGTRFIREVSDRTVGLYLITLTGAERNFTYWRSASAARLLAENKQALSAVSFAGRCNLFFRDYTCHSITRPTGEIFCPCCRK